jgi:hypothetical protein
VTIYNAVVPAMLAVDPTIKLSAIEYSDYGLGTGDGGDPMTYLPDVCGAGGCGRGECAGQHCFDALLQLAATSRITDHAT